MLELQDPEIFRTILDNLQTGVYLVDRNRKIVFWNDGAERITGYRRHEVLGRSCLENILLHCNDRECVLCGAACPLMGSIHDGKSSEAKVYFHHRAGHQVPVHVRAVPIRDRRGLVVGAAESFDEHEFVAESDSRLSSLAAHGCLDIGTGAMNRSFTQSHLRENLAFFAEHNLPLGILSLRVGHLEQFRATHGREAADAILHVVAQTVKHTLGAAGFLGHWTESEFLAILPNCDHTELNRTAASVQKIVDCTGIQWWGDTLSVNVSVGQSMVQPGDSAASILARAGSSIEQNPETPGVAGDGNAGGNRKS